MPCESFIRIFTLTAAVHVITLTENSDFTMAVATTHITETLIIPPGSRELFVSFSPDRPSNERDGWLGHGVFVAGISELRAGYLVRRPGCRHHFLGYVTGGAPVFRSHEEGAEEELSAGRVFFLPAGGLHYYAGTADFSMVWFHLDAGHGRWSHLAGRAAFRREARCLDEVRSLLERAFDESQSPTMDRSGGGVAASLCGVLCAYLERELAADAEPGAAGGLTMRARLERVWREAGRDPAFGWDVAALARRAGMSTSHFHAAVQSVYGTSPMRIIRNLRVDRVRALLLNTDHTLEVIAEMTGYESAFSLSRTFKSVAGCSPRDFRSQGRSQRKVSYR